MMSPSKYPGKTPVTSHQSPWKGSLTSLYQSSSQSIARLLTKPGHHDIQLLGRVRLEGYYSLELLDFILRCIFIHPIYSVYITFIHAYSNSTKDNLIPSTTVLTCAHILYLVFLFLLLWQLPVFLISWKGLLMHHQKTLQMLQCPEVCCEAFHHRSYQSRAPSGKPLRYFNSNLG